MPLYQAIPESHITVSKQVTIAHGEGYPMSVTTEDAIKEAKIIAEHLAERSPDINSLIDVGCAGGHFVRAWLKLNRGLAIGIDAHLHAHACAGMPILMRDIGQPLDVVPTADAVVCWDTAEHLPEEKADILVANLCKMSKNIFFSAAKPGKEGAVGHQNCKAVDWWGEKFKQHGYNIDDLAAWRRDLKAKIIAAQGPSYLYWIWTDESFLAIAGGK